MDGSENLIPWKPGESGNPEGSSRKARHKALLRAAFAERAGKSLPKELSDRLTLLTEDDRRKLREQVEGLTYAEALASRKWLEALFGDTASSAKATDQIIGYPDQYVQSTERHPMDYLSGTIAERGWDRLAMGVEMDNYYFYHHTLCGILIYCILVINFSVISVYKLSYLF